MKRRSFVLGAGRLTLLGALAAGVCGFSTPETTNSSPETCERDRRVCVRCRFVERCPRSRSKTAHTPVGEMRQ